MGINIKVNKNEFNSSASDSGLTCHETINTHIKMIQLNNSFSNVVYLTNHTLLEKGCENSQKEKFFY